MAQKAYFWRRTVFLLCYSKSLIHTESQAGALIAQDRRLIEQSSAVLLLQLQDAPLTQNTRGMS